MLYYPSQEHPTLFHNS